MTPPPENISKLLDLALRIREGGVSGTAREILKYGVQAVDYVELDPLILALGERYLPANLADRRIRVINTDGRLFVKQAPEKYDVAIIDVPAPATAQP